jgi:hypothetical protein
MMLGEILVKQGLLTQAQLASALTRKLARGARLGSYLIENNILTSDQVALALAEQFSVPPALEADFLHADPALRRRMVAHQAVELKAIPLFITHRRRIAVAMANPANPQALDRLAFILSSTVEPMVAAEAALDRQLELLFQVRRRRTAQTAVRRHSYLRQQAGIATPSADECEIRPALRSHRRRARGPRLAPLQPGKGRPDPCAPATPMEDALCFTPTPLSLLPQTRVHTPPTPTPLVARPTQTPLIIPITSAGAELAVEQIRFAADRQDLSDSLFTFMRACFGVGALFAVTGATAEGLFGFCDGRVCPDVEGMRFSLSLPSCFRIARSRRTTFRGQPPPDGAAVHVPLWIALGCPTPGDVLVSPVITDGLVTLLLYAQDDGNSRIHELAASQMEQVCEALSSSLLRLAV